MSLLARDTKSRGPKTLFVIPSFGLTHLPSQDLKAPKKKHERLD